MQCTSTWFSLYHSVLSQWGRPELQWEPKQLLQSVLAPSCQWVSIMSMHDFRGVSSYISNNQDVLISFTDASPKKKKEKDTRATSWLYHVWSLWIGPSGHRSRSLILRRLPARLDELMNIYPWWAFFSCWREGDRRGNLKEREDAMV